MSVRRYPFPTVLVPAAFVAALFAGAVAFAGERTATLKVDNMWCPSCPYIVKQTLAAVPGVEKVRVSFRDKTAVVTFDDSRTTVEALTAATRSVGYPSRPVAR